MEDNNASGSNTIKKGAAEELPENVAQNMPKLLAKGEPEEGHSESEEEQSQEHDSEEDEPKNDGTKKRVRFKEDLHEKHSRKKESHKRDPSKNHSHKKESRKKDSQKEDSHKKSEPKTPVLTCLIHIHCEGWKACGTKVSLISKMSKRNWKSLTRRRRSYTKKKKSSRNGLIGFMKVSRTIDLEINHGTRSKQQLGYY
jgi:hypothetical protein